MLVSVSECFLPSTSSLSPSLPPPALRPSSIDPLNYMLSLPSRYWQNIQALRALEQHLESVHGSKIDFSAKVNDCSTSIMNRTDDAHYKNCHMYSVQNKGKNTAPHRRSKKTWSCTYGPTEKTNVSHTRVEHYGAVKA